MARSIMVMGTASSVGKSVITAGLCRIFSNDGFKVAPFKSQNMALNSFITKEGGEMGRAQVVQAEAARITPHVCMNPILLKPTSDRKSQVIINGKVFMNMEAKEYYSYKPKLREIITTAYEELESNNDIIVLEGAGSPAEINLKENDIVNMGMAKISKSPVILVADIDRGGVFASILGTVMLLEPDERQMVKGIIINKFRGDIDILRPGLLKIEEMTNISVLGVLPFCDLKIEDEDSLSDKFSYTNSNTTCDVDIVVVKLPFISNFTDFDAIENIPNVRLRYIVSDKEIGEPDLIIIPGSKSTINDLMFIRNSGLEKALMKLNRKGIPIIGICAGMQILGNFIHDPHGFESEIREINGMGLLDISTVFHKEKTTIQIKANSKSDKSLFDSHSKQEFALEGYEIHMGNTNYGEQAIPFVMREDGEIIGVRNDSSNVYGTYLHGIFDNGEFTNVMINNLKKRKRMQYCINNIDDNADVPFDYKVFKDMQYEKLAKLIVDNVDVKEIYRIMGFE